MVPIKKYSFLNKIIYTINPKKRLSDFLSEAENIVINYEKAPLDSFFTGNSINVCNKYKSKVKRKKPSTSLCMIIASMLFAGIYVIFKLI